MKSAQEQTHHIPQGKHAMSAFFLRASDADQNLQNVLLILHLSVQIT